VFPEPARRTDARLRRYRPAHKNLAHITITFDCGMQKQIVTSKSCATNGFDGMADGIGRHVNRRAHWRVNRCMDGQHLAPRTRAVTAAAVTLAGVNPPVPPPSLPQMQTLEQFLAAISARAFRFAEAGLRQREDALDAVQDAMVRMLGYRERPAAEWTPLFWSILRSRMVDLQRRRTFRLRWFSAAPQHADGSEVDWLDEREPGPSRRHEGREAWAALAQALRRLPRRQREAFSLRVLEELDVPTTARIMGCSEGSVKTHLFRAREALKQQLEDFR